VTVEENKNKKDESKGFAGLSSLVSDMDTSLLPAAKKDPTSISGSSSSPLPPVPQTAQPQPRQKQTYQEPAQPSSGSSGAKWVLGIAAVIGVLWLIGQSDKSPTSLAPDYSPPAQIATPSYSPPAQPQEPSRPAELQPPVGQNLSLSTAQIRYCLAEDIRMDGAKAVVDSYSDSEVDRFNAIVSDYNSRCGKFRYRRGALESARQDIEPYRSQLQAEGRSRFAHNDKSSAEPIDPPVAPRQIPNEFSSQSMLLESLQIKPGTAERVLDSGKMIVALAKAGYVNLAPDSRADYSDYRFFKKPAFLLGSEIVAIDEEYFKEWVGCCVSRGVAITVKANGDTNALQDFARSNKCRVGFDGDMYYGPTLPYAPKGTYATLSCKERDAQ